MATDLETYAAHCRRMATARHRPDCPVKGNHTRFSEDGRASCLGCVTPSDRKRWALLAAEAEAYLARPTEDTRLP